MGGFLADRFTKKALAVTAMISAGMVISVLTNFGNVLWLAITLNTLMAIPAGMRFVSGNALLSELIPTARGTFMSMNSSIMEVGSMVGSSYGRIPAWEHGWLWDVGNRLWIIRSYRRPDSASLRG